MLEPIRRVLHCVKQTSEKGPSLGKKKEVKIPHQRSPYAMKFEDKSPGETARQERCAQSKAWNLAKNIFKLKEKRQGCILLSSPQSRGARKIHKLKQEDKATFYSPSEEWILPAASLINPDEREYVVDPGASMHLVSKKDLSKAELETVRMSKNPIMVVTANGEVQTKEEATVYVEMFARSFEIWDPRLPWSREFMPVLSLERHMLDARGKDTRFVFSNWALGGSVGRGNDSFLFQSSLHLDGHGYRTFDCEHGGLPSPSSSNSFVHPHKGYRVARTPSIFVCRAQAGCIGCDSQAVQLIVVVPVLVRWHAYSGQFLSVVHDGIPTLQALEGRRAAANHS